MKLICLGYLMRKLSSDWTASRRDGSVESSPVAMSNFGGSANLSVAVGLWHSTASSVLVSKCVGKVLGEGGSVGEVLEEWHGARHALV